MNHESLCLEEIDRENSDNKVNLSDKVQDDNTEHADNKDNVKELVYSIEDIVCLLSESDSSKYHKYCGFNKFTEQTFDLPTVEDGWKEKKNEYILTKSFNKNLSLYTKDKQIDFSVYDDWELFSTLDNYSIGFLVCIDNKNQNVHVYGRTTDVIPDSYNVNQLEIFNNLIGMYNPISIFIGRSGANDMSNFSGGFGDKYDGKSIFLRIGTETEYRYVFIGMNMVEFTTDEIITKYVSTVGNNQVPYPYAESENLCYCMSSFEKISVSNVPDREKLGHVYWSDGVEYSPMNHRVISGRNSDECIIEYVEDASEYVTFSEPVEYRYVEKSCSLYD